MCCFPASMREIERELQAEGQAVRKSRQGRCVKVFQLGQWASASFSLPGGWVGQPVLGCWLACRWNWEGRPALLPERDRDAAAAMLPPPQARGGGNAVPARWGTHGRQVLSGLRCSMQACLRFGVRPCHWVGPAVVAGMSVRQLLLSSSTKMLVVAGKVRVSQVSMSHASHAAGRHVCMCENVKWKSIPGHAMCTVNPK